MSGYTNFYNQLIENQKKFFENQKDMANFPFFMKPSDYMKAYEKWMETYNDWMKTQEKLFDGKTFPENPMEAWAQVMNGLNPMELLQTLGEKNKATFDKVMNANRFNLMMQNFYDEVQNNLLKPGIENYEQALQETTNALDSVFLEAFLPLLPENLRTFFQSPYEFAKTVTETMSNFSAPWRDSFPEMTSLLMKQPTTMEDYTDFLRIWQKNYNDTIGSLLKSPMIGQSRELFEQQNKAVNASVEMVLMMNQYVTSLMAAVQKESKLTLDDWAQTAEDLKEPMSYQEFYDYWSGKIEDAIIKYFFTDEYAELMGKTLEAFLDMKIETNRLFEKYFAETPIITEGKIDSLYKTVHDLKKKVKELEAKLEEANASEEA